MNTLVSCRDIHKSYKSKSVLQGLDFTLSAGESVAVVGENGAGKSTLLKLCAGTERADRGTVSIHGTIGYCPQEPGLIDLLTAEEHLRLTSAAGNDTAEAQQRGRAFLERLGFDTTDQTVARNLSGGQRQKLNLALTMMNDPQLLLLDEPYQGFDHGTYLNLWELIDEWKAEGRGVIVITHLLSETNRVDRVLRLHGGTLNDGGALNDGGNLTESREERR